MTVPDTLPSSAAGPALALLRVTGADARTFLDAQLTRNVPPASGPAALAGYCSPKGRLLATFVAWSDDDGIALVVARDVAETIAKRLRMYVLRAKAAIVDATATVRIDGVVGGDLPASLAAWDVAPWDVVRTDGATWVRYPDADGRARALRFADVAAEVTADAAADSDAVAGVDAATWRWLDIRAGLPSIGLAVQDRFVPQMVNLEALDGVDFRKGCFPGQEVVARSQYLGKLKRRTALASIAPGDEVPVPGTDVLDGDAGPVGLVVDAARGPDGAVAALVELPIASFGAATLAIGRADGPRVAIEPLPYALPDNEVFVRPKLS